MVLTPGAKLSEELFFIDERKILFLNSVVYTKDYYTKGMIISGKEKENGLIYMIAKLRVSMDTTSRKMDWLVFQWGKKPVKTTMLMD